MERPTQIKSAFWLAYFIGSVAVIGFMTAFLLGTPFYLMGYIYKPFIRVGDWILRCGVITLFKVQPWFSAEIQIPSNPGNLMMVSNHRSHLDAFILLSKVNGVRIMAKKSLFRIPFLGFMMHMMRQIPVRTGIESYVKAMDEVRQRLRNGQVVHVFPELTRCPPGFKGTQNFSLLPFQVAFQERRQILPVVFAGTDTAWPKGRKGLKFGAPIRARALPVIDPAQFKSVLELKNEVQRQIEMALQ
jgi:1-acyl-sn-glycerol-3-phosphate acyltransferase